MGCEATTTEERELMKTLPPLALAGFFTGASVFMAAPGDPQSWIAASVLGWAALGVLAVSKFFDLFEIRRRQP